MKLPNLELYTLLKSKDIHELNHANTVATAMTFIKQGGLLSRGGVESKSVFQTKQSSDEIDKKFDVWNDIFLDSTDLHTYFRRQNHYGPVLFKISTEFLIHEELEVWVTKDNPINWRASMTTEQKYFTSVKELNDNWSSYQRQRKMITIKNKLQPILFNYLTSVTIDKPEVDIVFDDEAPRIKLFNEAVIGLKESIGDNVKLKNKLIARECLNSCYCKKNYLKEVSTNELQKIFLPHTYGKR